MYWENRQPASQHKIVIECLHCFIHMDECIGQYWVGGKSVICCYLSLLNRSIVLVMIRIFKIEYKGTTLVCVWGLKFNFKTIYSQPNKVEWKFVYKSTQLLVYIFNIFSIKLMRRLYILLCHLKLQDMLSLLPVYMDTEYIPLLINRVLRLRPKWSPHWCVINFNFTFSSLKNFRFLSIWSGYEGSFFFGN